MVYITVREMKRHCVFSSRFVYTGHSTVDGRIQLKIQMLWTC